MKSDLDRPSRVRACIAVDTLSPSNRLTPLGLLILAALACSPLSQPLSPTATLTATEAPATRTPAPQPSPTLAATDTPAPALSGNGPWLLQVSRGGLFGWNEDGTGPVGLSSDPVFAAVDVTLNVGALTSWNLAIAPQGGRVGIVAIQTPETLEGLSLHLLTLPDGRLEPITPLIAQEIEAQAEPFGTSREDFARQALVGSLRWSPDGSRLAFLAALDGPVFDLYTYEPAQNRLLQLTDGTQAILGLDWSPEGDYLVYWGDFWMEPVMEGRGVVAADGDSPPVIYPDELAGGLIVGWSGPQTYIVYAWDINLGAHDLREFNIATGEARHLWPDVFTSVGLDPQSGRLALCLNRDEAEYHGQTNFGLYLVAPTSIRPQKISDDCQGGVGWAASEEAFIVGDALRLTLDGGLTALEADYAPADASPDGRWRVRSAAAGEDAGLWVAETGGEWRPVFSGKARSVVWRPDAAGFHSVGAEGNLYWAEAPGFEPVEIAAGVAFIGWVWP